MNKYDAIVLGAGMSGLACAIRLQMFDKKVCLLESHSIAGGLNSYYQRRCKVNKTIIKFDVGLHALTNYVPKKTKGAPLTKILKQLRLNYDDLMLCPQTYSLTSFPGIDLKFSNDFNLLESEIIDKFPSQIEGFKKLLSFINDFNELDLDKNTYQSSREFLAKFFTDSRLVEMILCPLLIYGSAWEDDMDFSQFVIMFKSIYLEGFSRPRGGVRTIIDLLLNKYKELGGEIRFRTEIKKIHIKDHSIYAVETNKEEIIQTSKVFSSIGLPETMELLSEKVEQSYEVGKMTFMESIMVLDRPIDRKDFDATIMFYNDSDKYIYKKSQDFYDKRSAVICVPDNYHDNQEDKVSQVRVTFMANYEKFKSLSKEAYLEKKNEAFEDALKIVKSKFKKFDYKILYKDIFTPLTVKKYTKHFKGTVYGSPDKLKDGKTPIDGLYVIGTDQGFLGIVGAILSGISIGNLYGLMEN